MENYVSSDYRRIAKEKTSPQIGTLVLITLIFIVIIGLISGLGQIGLTTQEIIDETTGEVVATMTVANPAMSTISTVLNFVVGGMFALSIAKICKKLNAGETVKVEDLFSSFKSGSNFTYLVTELLKSVFVVLWTLLFVIPGLVKSYAYAMTTYVWEDNPSIGANEAITESRRLMNGHKMELFLLDLSYIGWILLSILTLGILLLWVKPRMDMAHYEFYLNISGKNQKEEPITIDVI